MRKSALFIIIFIFGLSTASYAQFTGNAEVVTVQQVKEMNDESFVVLEGFIIKNLGDEHYMFRDDSGKIEVEIEDDIWRGQKVTPETRVRIQGQFDKDFTSKTIDVEQVSIVSGNRGQGN